FTVSIGLCILFNRNASSGGIDIIAKLLNKFLHIELGKAMSAAGMCVALSSALFYDSRTVILSVLGTYLNGIILDHFIFDQNLKRRVCIVSRKEAEIRNFILKDLTSGATIYDAVGAYTMDHHHEIITIVDRSEFQKLMKYLRETDPDAFVTVYKVSDMHYLPKKIV
ncbi:MAG: YitT family protein, partial [Eubacteriales bacterium]|nr:YitT family protein [Eubacteriales bacterium]